MIPVYVFLSKFEVGPGSSTDRYYKIIGLYTDKDQIMEIAHLTNIFATEEEVIHPVYIYEKEMELPEILLKQIYPDAGGDRKLILPVLSKKEDQVFAVILNADRTEGRGPEYLGALTSDPFLANKIAWGNGVCGSNADVKVLTLNKAMRYDLRLMRTKAGELITW